MEDQELDSSLETMRRHLEKTFQPEAIQVENNHVLVVREGQKVVDLEDIHDKHLFRPIRPKGTTTVHTLDSLIAHAKRHAREDTQAYCSLGPEPRIAVVYDDTPPAGDREEETGLNGAWREYRCVYEFPLSIAWKRWTAAAGKSHTVEEFAQLLEDGIVDVREPKTALAEGAPSLAGVTYATPTELLTLAQGLSVRVDQQCTEIHRRDNGTADVVFREQHTNEQGSPLRVPNGFLLGIPIFEGCDPYAVPVRLRYRLTAGRIVWSMTLHRASECLRDEAQRAAEKFRAETNVPLFYGEP